MPEYCACCNYPAADVEEHPVDPLYHDVNGVTITLCAVCYSSLVGTWYISRQVHDSTQVNLARTIAWGINRVLDEVRKVQDEMKVRPERFDFWKSMAARGVMPCPQHDCMMDSRFYYRSSGNDIQVAVSKDFDRWANSIDFVFSIPKTEKAFRRTMKRLEAAADHKADPREVGKAIRI